MARHVWWSVRRRFRVGFLIVVGHALAVVLVFGWLGGRVPDGWEMADHERASVERVVASSYDDYLRGTWSGDLAGLLAILGVVLGVGGAAAERRQGTRDLTLSLPVAPSEWLLVRWGVILALLLSLAAASVVLIEAGGYVLGDHVHGMVAAGTVLMAGIGSAFAVAVAILATTWTRDSIIAAVAALVLLYVTAGDGAGGLSGWAPGVLFDFHAWAGGPPWQPLTATAALTAASLILAVRRFERINDRG